MRELPNYKWVTSTGRELYNMTPLCFRLLPTVSSCHLHKPLNTLFLSTITHLSSFSYFKFLCFVLFSNLSHNLSRFWAYWNSTSPLFLKKSFISFKRDNLLSDLNSKHENCSFNCFRISMCMQERWKELLVKK